MVWVIAGLKVRVSIRNKLLLISAVLFVVPWIGVQYIQDMEDFLRINQEENLLGKAQIVAAVLQGQSEIFRSREKAIENDNSKITFNNSSHVYVRPIKRAIQLDGYMDDWLAFDSKAKSIKSDVPESLRYKYYLASYKKYLYVVLEVKDDEIVYRKANSLNLHKNDHVIIKLKNKEAELKTYFIATESPGWINAHRMQKKNNEWVSVSPELRIKGEWQETRDGYNVEIRLPLSLVGDDFSFYVVDVDSSVTREVISVSG